MGALLKMRASELADLQVANPENLHNRIEPIRSHSVFQRRSRDPRSPANVVRIQTALNATIPFHWGGLGDW